MYLGDVDDEVSEMIVALTIITGSKSVVQKLYLYDMYIYNL